MKCWGSFYIKVLPISNNRAQEGVNKKPHNMKIWNFEYYKTGF